MIYSLFINSLAIFIGAYLLSGISVQSYWTAIGVAILLAIVNTFVKPVLLFLTIPLTIVTFGLFILVINALMIMLVGKFIDGFVVAGFGWALIFSIVLSILNAILFKIL